MPSLASSVVPLQGENTNPEQDELYRLAERQLSIDTDDAAIAERFGTSYEPESRIQLREAGEARPAPTWGDELWRGVARGVDELKATGWAAGGVAAQALGAEDLADGAYENLLDNLASAEYNKGSVTDIRDATKSIDSAMRYAIGGIGSQLPMFIPSLATGGVGAAIAKKGAQALAMEWAGKYGAEKAAEMVAKRIAIGAGVGAYASSSPMEIGQIGQQNAIQSEGNFDPTTAVPGGLLAGSLDALPAGKILTRVLGPKITNKALSEAERVLADKWAKQNPFKAGAGRVAKEALTTGLLEGGTEGVQTIIENIASKISSPDPFEWTEEDNWQVANAVILGAGLGGGLGGLSGIVKPKPLKLAPSSNPNVAASEDLIEQKAQTIYPPEGEEQAYEPTPEDNADAERLTAYNRLDEINARIEADGETPELVAEREAIRTQVGAPAPIAEGDAANADGENTQVKPTVEQTESPGSRVTDKQGRKGEILKDNGDGTLQVEWKDGTIGTVDSLEVERNKKTSVKNKNHINIVQVGSGFAVVRTNDNGEQVSIRNFDATNHGSQRGAYNAAVEHAQKEAEDNNYSGYFDYENTFKNVGAKSNAKTSAETNPIQTEIDALEAQIAESGDPDRTLGVRKKELEAALVSDPQSTKPTRARQDAGIEVEPEPTDGLPNPVLRPEQAAAASINRVADRLIVGKTNTEEAGKIREKLQEVLTPLAKLLAGTKAKLYTRTDYVKSNPGSATNPSKFFVGYHPETGDIHFVVPEPRSLVNSASDIEALRENRIPKNVEHEAIHIGYLKALQERYAASNSKLSRGAYMTQQGANLWNAFQLSDPAISSKLGAVYTVKDSEGNPAQLSDSQKAAEVIRMIIERQRTGQITEDINFLDLQARQKGTIGQQAKEVLGKLLDALRIIRNAINRYIVNPTPAIKRILDETNTILDQYNAVLPPETNEPTAQTQANSGAKVAAESRVDNVNEKNNSSKQPPEPKADVKQEETRAQKAQRQYREAQDRYAESGEPNAALASDMEFKGKNAKAEGMRASYENRLAEGRLTGREQEAYDREAQARKIGRKVTTPQGTGTVEKAPAFGRTGVRLDSGEYVSLPNENVQVYGNNNLQAGDDYSDPIAHFARTGEAPRTPVNAPLKKGTDAIIDGIQKKWTKALAEKQGNETSQIREQALRAIRNSPFTKTISTQAQLPEMRRAMETISELGAMNVAEELSKNIDGTSLGYNKYKDAAALTALQFFTKAILDETVGHLSLNAGNPTERTRISTASAAIIEAMAEQKESAGRSTGILANLNSMLTGVHASKHYVGALYSSIAGSNPKAIRDANKAFRDAYEKIRDKVLTEGEAVTKASLSILRNSRKALLTPEGKRAVRQTQAEYIAKDIGRPNATPEDVGSWLFQAADDLSSAASGAVNNFVKSVAGRISFSMPNFTPQSAEKLILNAIHKSIEGPLTEAQIYGPKSKIKPPSQVEQIKMILANPDMKAAMIDEIENNVAKFYDLGTKDPMFQQHKSIFEDIRKDSEIGEKAIGGAARETMNKLRVTIPGLLRKHWTKARVDMDAVKEDFRKQLKDTGASDEVINSVADSLDKFVNEKYEAALNKTLSFKENPNGTITAPGTKDAIAKFNEIMPSVLSKDVKTIRDITKLGSADLGEYKSNLADFYVRYLGLPNTKEHPLAAKAAATMSKTLDVLIADQSSKEKQALRDAADALADILPKKLSSNKEPIIQKIIHAANRGFLGEASLYEAFRKTNPGANLPAYDAGFEDYVRQRNDIISMLPFEQARQVELQKLNREIMQKSKVSAMDLVYGYGYFAMLSGVGTQEVNVQGNLVTLAPNVLMWGAQNPGNIGTMLGNLAFAATHQAYDAAILALKEGVDPTKQSKLFNSSAWENATPQNNPVWHKITGPGKYVFRLLDFTDAYFKNLTFYSRLGASGYSFQDAEARELALNNARGQIKSYGIEDKSGKLAAIMADEAIKAAKVIQQDDLDIASYKGLEGAFQLKPKGLWGMVSGAINEFASKGQKAKLLKFGAVPFTDVVANIANETLNWGPLGLARYVQSVWPQHWSDGGMKGLRQEWRIQSSTDPEGIVDKDLLIKGAIGTLGLTAGMMLFTGLGEDKDKRRYVDLYGGGPLDPQTKELGFKKWSIRIGNTYIPFSNIPCLAINLGVLASIRDAERKGKLSQSVIERAGYAMGAFAGVTIDQSYLKGVSDFFNAVQDLSTGKGMKSLERWASYNSVGRLNPGILKTINSMIDPDIPDTPGFSEMVVGTLPFANLAMRPVLDYWGQPMQGQRFPTERIFTTGRDPLMRFLSSREIPLPGRGTPSYKGEFFDKEQTYEYNQLAGQALRKSIEANLPRIERMDKEEATTYIQSLSDEAKARAKSQVLNK